jgi:hypothetical protein
MGYGEKCLALISQDTEHSKSSLTPKYNFCHTVHKIEKCLMTHQEINRYQIRQLDRNLNRDFQFGLNVRSLGKAAPTKLFDPVIAGRKSQF